MLVVTKNRKQTGDFVSYLRSQYRSTGRVRPRPRGATGGGSDLPQRWRLADRRGEFVEVESGRSPGRPVLAQAFAVAHLHRVPLVVAKVDRLTRSLAFLTRLIEAGVDVRFCDLPKIEGPAGRFMLQQMAAVAELEAGMISKRTREALAAAKARGVKLGGRRNGQHLTPEMRAAGRAARVDKASARAKELAPTIAELRAAGVTTLGGIAGELSARGIRPHAAVQRGMRSKSLGCCSESLIEAAFCAIRPLEPLRSRCVNLAIKYGHGCTRTVEESARQTKTDPMYCSK